MQPQKRAFLYSAVFQKARALFLCEKNKTKKQLTIPCFGVNIFKQYANALIAQLDRVTGYEPVGRGFESLSARHGKSTCSSGAFFIYRTVAEFFYYRSGKLYSCPDKFFYRRTYKPRFAASLRQNARLRVLYHMIYILRQAMYRFRRPILAGKRKQTIFSRSG